MSSKKTHWAPQAVLADLNGEVVTESLGQTNGSTQQRKDKHMGTLLLFVPVYHPVSPRIPQILTSEVAKPSNVQHVCRDLESLGVVLYLIVLRDISILHNAQFLCQLVSILQKPSFWLERALVSEAISDPRAHHASHVPCFACLRCAYVESKITDLPYFASKVHTGVYLTSESPTKATGFSL